MYAVQLDSIIPLFMITNFASEKLIRLVKLDHFCL